MSESYFFRVVYPGGTYVRVSPHIESEHTGVILPFGTLISANKSLFLDGVNYVRLSDNSGWLFVSKESVEILELVDINRSPLKSGESLDNATELNYNSPLMNISKSFAPDKDKIIRLSRNEARQWKELRVQCSKFNSFVDFLSLVESSMYPAKFVIMDGISEKKSSSGHSGHSSLSPFKSEIENISPKEIHILRLVQAISLTVKQCANDLCDVRLFAPSLWVFVHMGSRIERIMLSVVEKANSVIDSCSEDLRRDLIDIAIEIGNRTKPQIAELSKSAFIIGDDIRNFIQRWIFAQISVTCAISRLTSFSMEDSPMPSSEPVALVAASPLANLNESLSKTALMSLHTEEISLSHKLTPVTSQSSEWSVCSYFCGFSRPDSSISKNLDSSSSSSSSSSSDVGPLGRMFRTFQTNMSRITNDPDLKYIGIL